MEILNLFDSLLLGKSSPTISILTGVVIQAIHSVEYFEEVGL
jgi:hypothetical protein